MLAREQLPCSSNRALRPGVRCRAQVSLKASSTITDSSSHRECSSSGASLDRRQLLGAAAAATLLSGRPAQAIQGLTAGRIPGICPAPLGNPCTHQQPSCTLAAGLRVRVCGWTDNTSRHLRQVPTVLLPPAGVTEEPDAAGYYTYTRPEGKSGGHGVGWSEVPRYSFKVPGGWEETPVSIADLGGTEVRQGRSCSKQYPL